MQKLPFLIGFLVTLLIIGISVVLPTGVDSASVKFHNLSERSLDVRILEADKEMKLTIAPKTQENRTVAGRASFILQYQTSDGLSLLNVPLVPKAETIVRVKPDSTVSIVVDLW